MMNKFWYLAGYSLKKKLKSKWFLVINIIIMLAIVSIMNIDTIIKFFGGDFSDTNEILVVDKTGVISPVFEKYLNNYNQELDTGYTFDIKIDNRDLEILEEEIVDTDKVIVVLDSNSNEYVTAKVISNSYIDTIYYQLLYQSLSSTKSEIAFALTNIDQKELEKVVSNIQIDRVILDENLKSEEENMNIVMSTVFPTVILPFFILVVFLVQMIGAEINEEKQTRSMEVIISNISPKAHFFSKILASNAFVLLQGFLLIMYSFLALFIKNNFGASSVSGITSEIANLWDGLVASGVVAKLNYIIPLTLILMILSFLTYSLVAGILASMTVSMEDYQQIQTPIMMICLLGYYLAIMAGLFQGSIFIRVLSYVPFLSCLLAPALLVIGQVGIFDVVISIIILIIFNAILIKYGLKIYKIGILNYSTDKMWKKIFRAFKSKDA